MGNAPCAMCNVDQYVQCVYSVQCAMIDSVCTLHSVCAMEILHCVCAMGGTYAALCSSGTLLHCTHLAENSSLSMLAIAFVFLFSFSFIFLFVFLFVSVFVFYLYLYLLQCCHHVEVCTDSMFQCWVIIQLLMKSFASQRLMYHISMHHNSFRMYTY